MHILQASPQEKVPKVEETFFFTIHCHYNSK